MKSHRELILEVWVHRCQPVKTGEQNKLPASRADSAKVATTAGRPGGWTLAGPMSQIFQEGV